MLARSIVISSETALGEQRNPQTIFQDDPR